MINIIANIIGTKPPVGGYDSRALSYFANITSAGGSLSNSEKTVFNTWFKAHDQIVGGVTLWSLFLERCFWAGGFAGAFVKQKYDVHSTCTNNGPVSGDYDTNAGFLWPYAGGKWIDTLCDTYLPASNQHFSVHVTNGRCIQDSGILMGANANLYLGNAQNNAAYAGFDLIGDPNGSYVNPIHPAAHGRRTIVRNGTNTIGFTEGAQIYSTTYVTPQVQGSLLIGRYGSLPGTFDIHGANVVGSIAGWSTGAATTAAQELAICAIDKALMIGLGRIKALRYLIISDSIGLGFNASGNNRWSKVLCDAFNAQEINLSIGSTLVQNSSGSAPGSAYDRRTTFAAMKPDKVFWIQGVNDYCFNDVNVTSATFQTQAEAVLQTLIDSGIAAKSINWGGPTYMNPAGYAGGGSTRPGPYDQGSDANRIAYVSVGQTAGSNKGVAIVGAVSSSGGIWGYINSHGGNNDIDTDKVHYVNAGHAELETGILTAV